MRGSIRLNWSAAKANGGAPILNYRIGCAPINRPEVPAAFTSVAGTKLSVQLGGLTPGVRYTCLVGATNSRGPSSALTLIYLFPKA